MTSVLIVEQFDPWRPKPGGIDTCIRGLIKYAPEDTAVYVAGVDATGEKEIGKWTCATIDGREFHFMPLVRLDHTNLARLIPHSVLLALGLTRFRPMRSAAVVQTHRINMGLAARLLYPRARLVQLIHSSGVANLGKGSKSFFRWAPFAYRMLEWVVIRLASSVYVFSKDGAERLRAGRRNVHFSPTWFDPDRFYPRPHNGQRVTSDEAIVRRVNRLLWACRIEPAKDPLLAVDAFAALSNEYRLTVAGSGALLGAMRERAGQRGVLNRVDFIGAVDKDKMGDLMREHDALLMTSVFEGFSMAIVEALACGLPVVTTPGGEPNGLVVARVNGGRFTGVDDIAAAITDASTSSQHGCVASVKELRASLVAGRIMDEGGRRDDN